MAQATSRRGSRRAVAPVRKPFPWGFAAGATVLALALVAIVVYAVQNQGSGFKTAADKLDAGIKGIKVTKNQTFNHVPGRVNYPGAATRPPDGGNHNVIPQSCKVYDQSVVNEHAVHSLEHGAVWITYRPDLPADQVTILKTLMDGNPYRMLSPYPGQASPVSLQAWGRELAVGSATDKRVARFVDDYTNGPQTREKGTACQGVDVPGTTPFVVGPDGKSFVPEGSASGIAPAPPGAPTPAAPTPAAPTPAAPTPAAPTP